MLDGRHGSMEQDSQELTSQDYTSPFSLTAEVSHVAR